MDKEFDDLPLSQSHVSIRLSEIQRRCADLLEAPDGLGLTLEEPPETPDSGNPYDRA